MSDTMSSRPPEESRSKAVGHHHDQWFGHLISPILPWQIEGDRIKGLCSSNGPEDLKSFLNETFDVEFFDEGAVGPLDQFADDTYHFIFCFGHIRHPRFAELHQLLGQAHRILKPSGTLTLEIDSDTGFKLQSFANLCTFSGSDMPDPSVLPLLARFYGFPRGIIELETALGDAVFWSRTERKSPSLPVLILQKEDSSQTATRFDAYFAVNHAKSLTVHGETMAAGLQQFLLQQEAEKNELGNRLSLANTQLATAHRALERQQAGLWSRAADTLREKLEPLSKKLEKRKARLQNSYRKRILRLIKSLLKKKWVRRRPIWVQWLTDYRDVRLPAQERPIPGISARLPEHLRSERSNELFEAFKQEIAGQK